MEAVFLVSALNALNIGKDLVVGRAGTRPTTLVLRQKYEVR